MAGALPFLDYFVKVHHRAYKPGLTNRTYRSGTSGYNAAESGFHGDKPPERIHSPAPLSTNAAHLSPILVHGVRPNGMPALSTGDPPNHCYPRLQSVPVRADVPPVAPAQHRSVQSE